MDFDEIKKTYFNYCCDLSSMCRDIGMIEGIIEVINMNSINWSNEFQKNILDEMITTTVQIDFCSLYGKYVLSCKSYDDFYDLSKVLYKIIVTDLFCFEGIYLYFYDTVFYTDNSTFKKEFMKYNSLIEYCKVMDSKKERELLDMSKVVLSKDSFHSKRYNNVKLLFEE